MTVTTFTWKWNLDTCALTSNNKVCVGEKAFRLHQCSGVTRVEDVKDAICIHPHWSVSCTHTHRDTHTTNQYDA